MKKEKPFWYMEQYRCGCTFVARFKKDLMGYCGRHGMDRQGVIYPLPTKNLTEADLGLDK